MDPTERYLKKIIERRVEANTACWVEFAVGKSDVDLDLGHNATEIGRIRGNLRELLRNETFDLDSIVITASCSPEGAYSANAQLSKRRSESVTQYFRSWMRHYADSLEAERGIHMDIDGNVISEPKAAAPDIRFIAHHNPENTRPGYSRAHALTRALLQASAGEDLSVPAHRPFRLPPAP